MNTSIPEIAENFIRKTTEILIKGGKGFGEIESEMLVQSKKCAAALMSLYAEQLDTAILQDKFGRRETGYAVERRGDERQIETQIGTINFQRTYYKKASGGYEYLADTALGLEGSERISNGLSLSLATAAKDMSYAKSSAHISAGEVSRQTVMSCVRRSDRVVETPEKRCVPELHIDADEAHVTLRGGKKSEVPLICVYEGIEKNGKRNSCKNIFHISEYGMKSDDLWESALTEIETRYDLTDTKIYLHGDGANWIHTGFEWLPNAVFVLDKYHKNKAIKTMTTVPVIGYSGNTAYIFRMFIFEYQVKHKII